MEVRVRTLLRIAWFYFCNAKDPHGRKLTPLESSNFLATIILFFLIPIALSAQGNYAFGTNVRVNDDPGGQAFHTVYSSGGRAIAARGDTVYLAYRGDQTGLSTIYFTKSTDCGQTWTPGLRVSYPEQGIIHGLAVDQSGDIFIVYTHVRIPNYEDIHFTRSTDGGVSFSYPMRISDDTLHNQDHPAIAVDTSGQQVFVVWMDARETTEWDIYFDRSTDGGFSFGTDIRVDDTGNDTSWQRRPSMAVDKAGANVYVSWTDWRNPSTDNDIYFARSTDGGQSFLPNVLVNDTAATGSASQWQPSLAVDTLGRIFIVWDSEQPVRGCYFSRSDDGGLTFGPEVRVIDIPQEFNIGFPSIAVDDSDGVYVAWEAYHPYYSGDRIFFAFSDVAGDSFMANIKVDDLLGGEYWLWAPTLAINEEKDVFVAWMDDRLNHMNAFDIYFATGTYVGIEEYAGRTPSAFHPWCHPNPFRRSTRFRIHDPGYVVGDFSLRIYDVSGCLVKRFSDLALDALRPMNIIWDGRDGQGNEVPCGTYFVEVSNDKIREFIKIVKIK
jgi:hypothetical protein